jgi:hypothetical protein
LISKNTEVSSERALEVAKINARNLAIQPIEDLEAAYEQRIIDLQKTHGEELDDLKNIIADFAKGLSGVPEQIGSVGRGGVDKQLKKKIQNYLNNDKVKLILEEWAERALAQQVLALNAHENESENENEDENNDEKIENLTQAVEDTHIHEVAVAVV